MKFLVSLIFLVGFSLTSQYSISGQPAKDSSCNAEIQKANDRGACQPTYKADLNACVMRLSKTCSTQYTLYLNMRTTIMPDAICGAEFHPCSQKAKGKSQQCLFSRLSPNCLNQVNSLFKRFEEKRPDCAQLYQAAEKKCASAGTYVSQLHCEKNELIKMPTICQTETVTKAILNGRRLSSLRAQ